MVVCFIALGIFAVMGLFSLRYRRLAEEAFDCVLRRVTFRPCTSRLDQRIKAKIVSGVMKGSPAAAGFVNRNFELLSWIFVMLTLASLFFAAQGIYNFAAFGNCNGPTGGACVYDSILGFGGQAVPCVNGTAP